MTGDVTNGPDPQDAEEKAEQIAARLAAADESVGAQVGIEDVPTEEALAEILASGEEETVHLPIEVQIADEDSDDLILRKLASHGVHLGKGMIAPGMFWPSLLIILAVVALAVIAPDLTSTIFTGVNGWIVDNLGWYYMLVISALVFVSIGIAISRFGKVPLGRKGDEPEFGIASWFAMLFAAGMGIGLVF